MISRNIETQTEKEIGNLTVQKKCHRQKEEKEKNNGWFRPSVTTLHWTPKASSRYSPSTGQNDAR